MPRDGRALRARRAADRVRRVGRPTARDVRHVAVEFVHPVIVGKRALPALGVASARRRAARAARRHRDGVRRRPEVAGAVARRAAPGCLTVAFAPVGAEWELAPPTDDPFVAQELVETTYHVLWELVHVFFEHRGLLAGRDDRAGPRHRRVGFLYPFLGEAEDDLDAVLADVRGVGAGQGRRGRRAARADARRRARRARRPRPRAARLLRRAAASCWRSATAARRPTRWTRSPTCATPPRAALPPRPAIDLTEDAAILTAIANDVGVEAMFARQVIAYGRAGRRAAGALDERRTRRNVIAALAEARRRGLATIAFVGYDGGRIAAEGWPTTSSSRARSTSRASRRRRRARGTCCASWSRSRGERARRARPRHGASRCASTGVVQGVGFRPFVYRLAGELGLAGFVRNDARGVELEVEGAPGRSTRFLARLVARRAAARAVERVRARRRRRARRRGFAIARERAAGAPDALVIADARDVRRLPAPSCSTRPTAATATRSSTARTAARASRSCAACPTTGR